MTLLSFINTGSQVTKTSHGYPPLYIIIIMAFHSKFTSNLLCIVFFLTVTLGSPKNSVYTHNPFLVPETPTRIDNAEYKIPLEGDLTVIIVEIPGSSEKLKNKINVNRPSPAQNVPFKAEDASHSIPSVPTKFGGADIDEGSTDSYKAKSDSKCEEYNKEIMGQSEGLSLTGTNGGVITVDNDKCTNSQGFVSGGTPTTFGEFPHMVALGKRSITGNFTLYCGGSLISHSWVLTAAHCTYGPNGSPNAARIGFQKLNDALGIATGIKRIVRHPTYKPPAMYADIALVELQDPVTFSHSIRPACLYQKYDSVPTRAWVTGWGAQEFGGDRSTELRKAFLDIIDNVQCSIRHNGSLSVPHGIAPSMICAGDPQNNWTRDTCSGDSGGPIQIAHPNHICLFQVIGITSFGEGCAVVNSPGVYTRVSHYLDWIEGIVWP
ncbi:tryptase-like isoform X2 [Prorops nasuta]|uniref:tryptase-like isoform X2 n=1 Tax=Prorops nasuta TaxID=863751 RepID=UPI0034D00733